MTIDAYGLDGASYQTVQDAGAVFGNGIRFAFWKATEGTYYQNPNFAVSMNALHGAGVRMSPYHFAIGNATAEATYFKAMAGGWLGPGNVYPMLDMEYSGMRMAMAVAHLGKLAVPETDDAEEKLDRLALAMHATDTHVQANEQHWHTMSTQDRDELLHLARLTMPTRRVSAASLDGFRELARTAVASTNMFINTFFDTLGVEGMLLYANQDWWTNVLDPASWGSRNILGHIASYTGNPGVPNWTYPRMAVHQHTDAGSVPGIPGNVDRDCTMPGWTLDQITLGDGDVALTDDDIARIWNYTLGSPGYWSQQKAGAILITLWTAVYGDASGTPGLAPNGIIGKLNTVTRQIPSGVEGSTYTADGMQYAANSDSYGFNAANTLDEIKTAVQALSTPTVDTDALAAAMGPALASAVEASLSGLSDADVQRVADAVNQELAQRMQA